VVVVLRLLLHGRRQLTLPSLPPSLPPGPPPRSSFLQYTYSVPNDFLAADGVNTLSVSIEPALEYTGKGGREGGREEGKVKRGPH